MDKIDLLFDWAITELNRISSSAEADSFANDLEGDRLDCFVQISDEMRRLADDASECKSLKIHFTRWMEVANCFKALQQDFPDFPHSTPLKFRLMAAISQKIYSISATFDTESINAHLFEITPLHIKFLTPFFCKQNKQFPDSIIIFSSSNYDKLIESLDSEILSPKILFHFLITLLLHPELPPDFAVFTKKTSPPAPRLAIEAFTKISLLAAGHPISPTLSYSAKPTLLDPDCIALGDDYVQWNELFHVLNEYNSRSEILVKYLTIYHVIENLMFKRPIVELESKMGGRMFSVRDFRRLYKRVEESEISAIKALFKTISKMSTGSLSFDKHWFGSWTKNFPSAKIPEANMVMDTLGLTIKHKDFSIGTIPDHLALLIYAIRNSIVHNKETEFHLTHHSLGLEFTLMIESFLIPTLEEICFSMIGKKNPELWYSQSKLLFYET